jgi:4-aminobutyrate aminotransferase/(S)-3-amino-2-methylpropionate transaminase
MEEQDLAGRAQQLGAMMMDRLNALAEKFDVIAQVRGRGAMVAIEFADPGTLTPRADLPKALAARCTQEGVVILTAGTFGNVIRLLPPLVISDELLAEGLDVLADALAAELSA